MSLTLRRDLNRVLTKDEVDDNFVFLNTKIDDLTIVVEDLPFVKTVALLTPDVNGDITIDPLKETLGINIKVDKIAGKGLSSEDFTSAEKTKLAGLQGSHFRGTFTSLGALISGVPTPSAGDYADVDTVGTEAIRYIWDATDSEWTEGGTSDPLTAAQVKTLYESNPDTNAFTDAEETKLAGVEAGATANQTDAFLRARANHTGTQLAATISDLSAAIAAETAGKLDKTGGTMSGALNLAPIATLASSATLAIGAAASNTITITGTTGITGFDSIASGAVRTLVFSGIVTLSHNAVSLILPKGIDLTTAPGDVLQFTSLGGGNWRCTGVLLAAGTVTWGTISGTLSAQTDLQAALDAQSTRSTNLEWGYVSPQQNYVAAGNVLLSHGLGVIPARVTVDLVCLTAEYGYSAGDTVPMGPCWQYAISTFLYGFTMRVTSTQISFRSAASGLSVINNATGGIAAITPASWKLVFKASKS